MMRNVIVARAALAAAALGLASVPAFAGTITLDQSHSSTTDFGNVNYDANDAEYCDLAQTFTVGLAGKLDHIELLLTRDASNASSLIVDVRTTSAGSPTTANSGATVLASGTVATSAVSSHDTRSPNPGWVSVDLSSFNLTVAAGQLLSITLRTGAADENWYWWGATSDTYSGGGAFYRLTSGSGAWSAHPNNTDFGFKSWVDVPTTAAVVPLPPAALLGFGLLGGMGLVRRLRRRRDF